VVVYKPTEQELNDKLSTFYDSATIYTDKAFPVPVKGILDSSGFYDPNIKYDFVRIGALAASVTSMIVGFVLLTVVAVIEESAWPYTIWAFVWGGLLWVSIRGGKIHAMKSKAHVDMVKLLPNNYSFKNAYNEWLNTRYGIPALSDESINNAMANNTFKFNDDYFTQVWNENKNKIKTVRQASPEEIIAYEAFKDRLEVTYL